MARSKLQHEDVHIPFSGPLDEKTHKFLVPGNAMLKLHNAVRSKTGSVEKRSGYKKLGTSVLVSGTARSIQRAYGLAVKGDHLLQAAETDEVDANSLTLRRGLYGWSEPDNKWKRLGQIGRCVTEAKEVMPASTLNVLYADLVTDGRYTLYAWQEDGGDLQLAVTDANGNVVATKSYAVTDSSTYPVCFRGGTNGTAGSGDILCVGWADGSNLKLTRFKTTDPSNPFDITTTLVTNLHTDRAFDIIWNRDQGNAISSLVNSLGNLLVSHLSCHGSSFSTSGTLAYSSTTPAKLTLARNEGAAGVIFLMTASGSTVEARTIDDPAYNQTLTARAGAVTILASGAPIRIAACWDPRNSRFRAFYDQEQSGALGTSGERGGEYIEKWWADVDLLNVSASAVLKRGLAILARPIVRHAVSGSDTGQVLLPVLRNSPLQGTGFLVDVDSGVITSRFMVGTCNKPNSGVALMRVPAAHAASETGAPSTWTDFRFAAKRKLFVKARSGGAGIWTDKGLDGLAQVSVALTGRKYPAAQFGRSLVIAGDMLQVFDGKDVHELPFHHGPEQYEAGVSTPSTGGSLVDGTYYISFTYEYRDAAGQLWRSAPTPPVGVEIDNDTSTSTLEAQCETLRATDIPGDISIVMWRTEANGTVLHRCGSQAAKPATSGAATDAPRLNDSTVAAASFVSTESDAVIREHEVLYTSGGVLDNVAPGGAKTITAWRDRLILGGMDDSPSGLWFSKGFVDGLGVEFSDVQVLELASQGRQATGSERISGLGVLDDTLIVLTESQVFAMLGSGPDARGLGSSFQGPVSVDTSSGCTDPRSVVRIPAGLLFQSKQGIQMLDRGMRLSYFGAPVEDSLGSNTVVGGVVLPGQSRCILRHAGGALVYDWHHGQWSTFADLGGATDPVGAAQWDAAEVMLNGDGVVWQSDSSLSADDGTAFTPEIKTGWFNLAGLQGFQRVWRAGVLGEKLSDCEFQVGVAYDYDDTDVATYTLNLTGLATPLTKRIHLRKQKCKAIRFKLTHSTPGLAGSQKFVLSGLSLEVGIKNGLQKLGSARSKG